MNSSSMDKLEFGSYRFSVSRPHRFGIVIDGPDERGPSDYLHDILLHPEHRDAFMDLIESEGLVICKRLETTAQTYRKVRGKSSGGKLSQAEYYHHDGCSCPTKPRVVEIRLPYQDIARNVATAIAPFRDVLDAMLQSLPESCEEDGIEEFRHAFAADSDAVPPVEMWEKIQGRVLRLARRKLDAETCRAYYRDVDRRAEAYDLPWEMGESRLMLNGHDDLSKTMQHRRAYQRPRDSQEQNGSLVKRWTAEEA